MVKSYKLTEKEDSVWEDSFEYYKNEGYSDKKADELAYKDLVKEFPHIKKYKKIQ